MSVEQAVEDAQEVAVVRLLRMKLRRLPIVFNRVLSAPVSLWLLLLGIALLDLLTPPHISLASFYLVPVLLAAGLLSLLHTLVIGGVALLLALAIGAHQEIQSTPMYWLQLLAMVTIVMLARALSRERMQLERSYRLLAENASDVVFSTSPQGVTQWVSSSLHALTGWYPQDLIGRAFGEFVHPDDIAELHEAEAAFQRGEVHRFELRVRCLQGGYRSVGVTGRGLRSAAGPVTAIVGSWRDIRPEQLARQALASSEQLARQALENIITAAPIGMYLCEPGLGTFLKVNPALCRFFGRSEGELLGLQWQTLTHPEDLAKDEALAAEVLDGTRSSYRLRKRFLHQDGSVLWGDLAVSIRRDVEGKVLEVIAQIIDVTDQVETEADLTQQARHDLLTGLLNRRGLEERLSAMDGRRRSDLPLAVLFCDIDHFKAINDGQGHAAGDAVLRVVAHRLRRAIRQTDLAARFGGDELVVLLEGVGTEQGVEPESLVLALAEKIRRHVAEPIPFDQGSLCISLSIGMALIQLEESPQEFLARADAALYSAKQAGRNRVVLSCGDRPSLAAGPSK
ncbi:GGDEF domain-containing protein [Synechococcus sp. CS-1328]|uniref:sensor domain-containing diguanylate cyclase n=1 Tax=Synechococcus sp. CS-1328 TaxID=2847976 RepID=UPI00223AA90C|nr:GGDEF domain-containing protein [Synechococcus sp. CS-1328]MCT0223660.1 diguanylate cyclase [Synechococcus sp. CS-1328]